MRNFKKFLSLVLAIIMITGTMVAVSANTAVTTSAPSTSTEAISFLGILGVFKGVSPTDLGADQLVTREQMAMFISRVKTGQTDASFWTASENTTKFTDLRDPGFFGAIAYAHGIGVINGTSETTFAPTANITYQEAVTMIVRALGVEDKEHPFVYPYGYLDYADTNGLADGLGIVGWTTPITRAQTAQLVYNLLVAETIPVKNTNPVQYTSLLATKFKVTPVVSKVVATELQSVSGELSRPGTVRLENGKEVPVSKLDATRTAESYLNTYLTVTLYNNADVLGVAPVASKTVENMNTGKFAPLVINGKNVDGHVIIDGVTYHVYGPALPEKHTKLSVKEIYNLTPGKSATTLSYVKDANGVVTPEYEMTAKLDADGNEVKENDVVVLVPKLDANGKKIQKTKSVDNGTFTDVVHVESIYNTEFGKIEITKVGDSYEAIFVRYSLGKYSEKSAADGVYNYSTNKTAKTTSPQMTGVNGNNAVQFQSYKLDTTSSTVFRTPDLKVNGAVTKLTANNFYVYTYNFFNRTVTVAQDLGKELTGTVSSFTTKTVTIDGVTYDLARPMMNRVGAYTGDPAELKAEREKDLVDRQGIVLNALSLHKTFQVKFVSVGGKLASVAAVSAPAANFMVLKSSVADGVTLHADSLTGFLGVAINGNLLVKAIVDNTGLEKIVEITAVNGSSVRLSAEDLSGIQSNTRKIMVNGKEVSYTYFDSLTLDNVISKFSTNKTKETMLKALKVAPVLAIVSSENGVYSVDTRTGETPEQAANFPTSYVQRSAPKTASVTFDAVGSFEAEFATKVDGGVAQDKIWMVDEKAVFMFIAKDGVRVFTGVPAKGASILLTGSTLYRATPTFIVVRNDDVNLHTANGVTGLITNFTFQAPEVSKDTEYKSAYYITKDSKHIATSVEAGKVVYTIEKVYNVLTGATETVAFDTLIAIDANKGMIYATDAEGNSDYIPQYEFFKSLNSKLVAGKLDDREVSGKLVADIQEYVVGAKDPTTDKYAVTLSTAERVVLESVSFVKFNDKHEVSTPGTKFDSSNALFIYDEKAGTITGYILNDNIKAILEKDGK